MPAANPPRWIAVRKPFDYHWPGRAAVTAFAEADLGEHYVKAEVADHAVAGGFASEGKLDGSEAKAPKAKRTRRRKAVKAKADAAPTDTAADNGLAGSGVAADDSAKVRGAVDPATE
jgi:hypothetical protein